MDTMSSVFFPPSHFACIGRIDEETENEEKHPIATMEKITTLQLSIGLLVDRSVVTVETNGRIVVFARGNLLVRTGRKTIRVEKDWPFLRSR